VSANDDIQDALTRHQVFVLRYARGRENEAAKFVRNSILSVIQRMEDDPFGDNQQRNAALIAELYQYLIALNTEHTEELMKELERFAEYEANYVSKMMSSKVESRFQQIAPQQINQAVFGNVLNMEPIRGYKIKDALDEFGIINATKVQTLLREGILLGTSNEDIAQSIRDIIPTQERRATTLARTVTNYAANKARNETIKQNADIMEGYKWVATLDSRTSLICASRDGKIYEIDDRNPKPPAHFNCRSTITFVVNPEYDLGRNIKGTRPSKGDVKTDVSGDTTYAQWLRKQSPDFQDKVLGPVRAKLFRSRKLSLDRFVDDRGNVLSLEELGIDDDLFI
jgi:SPP1 gp7 family putative phage head morphogenesis protein